MNSDLITKKIRQEFRECLVGRTLREIEMIFDAAGIRCNSGYVPNTSGQRRSLVEQYYHSVDFSNWADVRKVLVAYEDILISLGEQSNDGSPWADNAKKTLEHLTKCLERGGFRYADGKIVRTAGEVDLQHITNVATHLDAPELQRQIDRLRAAVDEDPALAVGTSKELLETTCKTILHEIGVSVDPNWDLSRLVKEARERLGLMPEQIPEKARGAEVIRKLLGSLGALAQSMAELRNLYGTGHGKHAKHSTVEPRHARLAVGAASTLASFLFETHEARKGRSAV